MSRTNLSGYVRHATIFSRMCCLVVGLGLVLGLGSDLVCLVGKLLCTRICAILGCNCHSGFSNDLVELYNLLCFRLPNAYCVFQDFSPSLPVGMYTPIFGDTPNNVTDGI